MLHQLFKFEYDNNVYEVTDVNISSGNLGTYHIEFRWNSNTGFGSTTLAQHATHEFDEEGRQIIGDPILDFEGKSVEFTKTLILAWVRSHSIK